MVLPARQRAAEGEASLLMGGLSATELLIICGIIVIVLALVVLGLRRGTLKSASVRTMGVSAGVEGHKEAQPLPDQTMQTDGLKVNKSDIRMVKSAKTVFKRTRFKNSTLDIVSDDVPQRPTDQPPAADGRDGS